MFGEEAAFHQEGGTPMNYACIDYQKTYSANTITPNNNATTKSANRSSDSFSSSII
jgi:hypothetical protein